MLKHYYNICMIVEQDSRIGNTPMTHTHLCVMSAHACVEDLSLHFPSQAWIHKLKNEIVGKHFETSSYSYICEARH